jgi:hypothetical protein
MFQYIDRQPFPIFPFTLNPIAVNLRTNTMYKAEGQIHEFPLLFKEGWRGKLISGDFETLIARTGWLIFLEEENSEDNLALITLWISVDLKPTTPAGD